MTVSMSVEEVGIKLKEIIEQMSVEDEIVITENQQAIARLILERPQKLLPRPAAGLGVGSIVYMAPDFDAPLEDFQEYME